MANRVSRVLQQMNQTADNAPLDVPVNFGNGHNRVLIAFINYRQVSGHDYNNANAVVCDGRNATQIRAAFDTGTQYRLQVWALKDPPEGIANVTFRPQNGTALNLQCYVGVVAIENADYDELIASLGTKLASNSSNSSPAGSTLSATVASDADELVLLITAGREGGAWSTRTATAGAVITSLVQAPAGPDTGALGLYLAVGDGPGSSGNVSPSMSWDNLAGAIARTVAISVPYKAPPGPQFTSITPDEGTAAGGTPVTIVGANFVDGVEVTIGGAPATDVVFVDDETITCVTPPGTAGAADVVITNPDESTVTATGAFTYIAQVLTEFEITEADGNPVLANFASGSPRTIRIRALDQNGDLIATYTSTVDVSSNGSLSSGAGTTSAFVGGVRTVSIAFDTPQANVSIAVEDTLTGLVTGASNVFTVTEPAVLTTFEIRTVGGQTITEMTATVATSVRIRALDQNGNVFAGFTGTVQIATEGGSLTGGSGATAAFTAGVLAAHSVTYATPAGGVRLVATDTATGEVEGASAFFDVVGAGGGSSLIGGASALIG